MRSKTTRKITVTGLVQGVGYRPFVAELAEQLQLTGQVKNVGGIVKITVAGSNQALNEFVERLNAFCPEGARVDKVEVEKVEEEEFFGTFSIVESLAGEEELTFVPADIATCSRCEAELLDASNRRYQHPFISCVSCGPRFSIIQELPYDRDKITMREFPLCGDCQAEYTAQGNVRRHAQTIACKSCGPRLTLWEKECQGALVGAQALERAVALLFRGKIGAIKDIGGYHFAFMPSEPEAARRLREFKNREHKPFAVMFPNLEAIRDYCYVSEQEESILLSGARPIVLLNKKMDFDYEICKESDRIGAMLPCNPLQILLTQKTGPLVMTSGNRGGEPIITEDEEMKALLELGGIDFMLLHDRHILTPLEDSILQVIPVGNRELVQMLRRGRGYVPEPISLARNLPSPSYAAGGDLKAVFALGKKNQAYLSSHFGDLEDYRCVQKRENSLSHMRKLFHINPCVSVGDMHPAYVSAREVEKRFYHHHSHIMSVMAEHGLDGRESRKGILGVAYDGTGYGADQTVWGGEFLLCKGSSFTRIGHLRTVKMQGSDEGARNARISLAAYLMTALEQGSISKQEFHQVFHSSEDETRCDLFARMRSNGVGVVESSSMGRLFDAVSALLGVNDYNHYEGECGMRLEAMAHRALSAKEPHLPLAFQLYLEDGIWVADSVQLLVDIMRAREQYKAETLALSFHRAVVKMTCDLAAKIGANAVALSGGSFCNRILLAGCIQGLEEMKCQVYTNEKVPCGDGGLALGQLYGLALEE